MTMMRINKARGIAAVIKSGDGDLFTNSELYGAFGRLSWASMDDKMTISERDAALDLSKVVHFELLTRSE